MLTATAYGLTFDTQLELKKDMKTSIKPILNRIGLKRTNYTLVLQIIRNRRRAVIFTPYRLQTAEFNSDKGTAMPLSRRKADVERAREINTYLQEQVAEIRRIVARMECAENAFTAHEIAVFYRQRCDRTLIHIFFNELIEELEQRGCYGTAASYRSTVNIFLRFAAGRKYHFKDLTETVLAGFERYLLLSDLQRNSRTFYMRVLRAVFNKAKKQGLVAPGQTPFDSVSFREDTTRKLAVGTKTLKTVVSTRPNNAELCITRDLFMFCFYARGMSFVDIAFLRRDQISEGFIRYKRRKTGQPFVVKLVPELQHLLDQYSWSHPWAMPVMMEEYQTGIRPLVQLADETDNKFQKRLYSQYKKALVHYTQSLENLSHKLDLPHKLTFNVARHSWASLAQDKGVPLSVISKGLGHSSESTTQIYLADLDARKVNDANEIVIDLNT